MKKIRKIFKVEIIWKVIVVISSILLILSALAPVLLIR